LAAELVRSRLLLWATAFAAAAALGIPWQLEIGPGLLAGPAIGIVLFFVLAGGPPRIPQRGAPAVCLRSAYLIAAAGFEELIWRGVVLALLASYTGTLSALVLTSVGFALWHVRSLGGRCVVHGLTGLAFGGAYLCGGITAAVVAHGLYNVLVDLSVQAAEASEGSV